MNPFLLPPAERLSEWRNFRNSLLHLDEMEQLEKVAYWVNQAPTSTYVLDYDNPKSWPGPWELINQGDFDDVAMAYLMEQTLLLLGWDPSRLTLHMVRNSAESFQSMILLVDKKWALNYAHASVFNFDNEHQNCAYLISYQVTSDGGHTEI